LENKVFDFIDARCNNEVYLWHIQNPRVKYTICNEMRVVMYNEDNMKECDCHQFQDTVFEFT